jgi:hypothetical protein
VPGDPKASLLISALRYSDADLKMPPKGKLPDDVVRNFETWVKMGAPDPRTERSEVGGRRRRDGALPKIGRNVSAEDVAAGRKWWSFTKPSALVVPVPKAAAWASSDIDRFLAVAMEDKGLTPAPDADRRTWLRRVTFDLVGLPPTPEELDAFEKDASAEAFEKVVDRLLVSPQCGERWGRHWLDVARYAESTGKETNVVYPHAWRYRDYVIDAFNRDRPYDRFIVEQLAGDLLPYQDAAQQADADRGDGLPRRRRQSAEPARPPSVRTRRRGRADRHDDSSDVGTDGRVCPMPRPQVRSYSAVRLLRRRRHLPLEAKPTTERSAGPQANYPRR